MKASLEKLWKVVELDGVDDRAGFGEGGSEGWG